MYCEACGFVNQMGSEVCASCEGALQPVATPSPEDAAPPHAEQGTVFGDYRVERLIGTGATGIVYLATQMSLRRDAALKVLNPHKANPRTVQRFEVEGGQELRLAPKARQRVEVVRSRTEAGRRSSISLAPTAMRSTSRVSRHRV